MNGLRLATSFLTRVPDDSVVVTEGSRKRTWVEIEGDLAPKVPVITSGHARLAEGSAVRVR